MTNHDDAGRIHAAALELLSNPGVRIEHERIVKLLRNHGARVAGSSQVVRFPAEMINEHLALCPKAVALTDRRGNTTQLTAHSAPVFWACPGMNLLHKGRHRLFTSSDMAAMSRLLDQLDQVHAVFGMAMEDVPPQARDVVGLKIMAENSTKHLRALCFSAAGADAMARMKSVIGDHPWFSVGFTAHGPLRWTNLALEIFARTAGHGIPVSVNGEPMAGASGPVTLAGSAAVGTAEILAGIVVNQALEPGRGCLFNLGLAHTFDMRSAVAVTGGPENALFAQVSAAMGRFYGLPSASWVSTESMVPDSQAALEKMFGFHTHMESGVNCIWGVSQLESELTVSPEQAVMDNEMIAYAKRYGRGVELADSAIALDVTREVGIAGTYLGHEHTAGNFRRELYMPAVLSRDRRATWERSGSLRLDERAAERAASLMQNKVENGLSAEQLREMEAIAGSALRQAVT